MGTYYNGAHISGNFNPVTKQKSQNKNAQKRNHSFIAL
jgi:hypothetical protein